MSALTAQQTTLPPQDRPAMGRLLRLVQEPTEQPPRLIGANGEQTELPHEVYQVLQQVIALMEQGRAVTVAPHNLQLTTQEAADILGLSRPTLIRILERGELPFTQPNRHRRVALADLLDYQRRAADARRASLDRTVQISQELGLYDDEGTEPPLQR